MNVPSSTFSLSRFVEAVRVVVPASGDALNVDWLPDGRTRLVFRVLEEGRRGDVSAAGPRTRALFKNASGVARAVTVQLKPGWAASLLGVAANALTDRIVTLEDLWGRSGSDLCLELLAAPSVPDVLDQLGRALELHSRQTFEPASGRLARHAVRLLEGGEARVDRVAEQLGVSARHLRRAFTESIGIGPKEFARTTRLQRAVRGVATAKDWACVAADAGYYDQAHLIADFRQLVGLAPGAFLKRTGGVGMRFASKNVAAA
jgi:AraC-like DNA-binding protein